MRQCKGESYCMQVANAVKTDVLQKPQDLTSCHTRLSPGWLCKLEAKESGVHLGTHLKWANVQ